MKQFKPMFKGPIEGFVVNYLRRNFWRLEATMEYEDVLQEAYVVFLHVAKTYPDIKEAKHFMALFRTAWTNRVTDLSLQDSKRRENEAGYDDGDQPGEYTRDVLGELDNAGALTVAIKQAPEEIRRVLSLFLNAPVELLDLASQAWKSRGRKKDHGNAMLCQMLDFPNGTDVVGIVEDYFSE